jgi:tetratricopeptide (TPR) repeat protein
VFQNLTQHGFDVFFDFNGIGSGDFEPIILGNIWARAHFLVLLSPSALDRCKDPGDWLRREIETALAAQRNIVPLMFDGFDFGTPAIAEQLGSTLERLKSYQALRVPVDYFAEAMERLRQRFLAVPLNAVLHPLSRRQEEEVALQQRAAVSAPSVLNRELTSQHYLERGREASDLDEKVRLYSEAIRLDPDNGAAYFFRSLVRYSLREFSMAREDLDTAIARSPGVAEAYCNRAVLRKGEGNLEGALADCDQAISLAPDLSDAYFNRGILRRLTGDLSGAREDFDEKIKLTPDDPDAFMERAKVLTMLRFPLEAARDRARAEEKGKKVGKRPIKGIAER